MVAVRGRAGGDLLSLAHPLGLLHMATSSVPADQFQARGRKRSLPQRGVRSLLLGTAGSDSISHLSSGEGTFVDTHVQVGKGAGTNVPCKNPNAAVEFGVRESDTAFVISLNGIPDCHGSVQWLVFVLYNIYLKNHDVADSHNAQSLKKIFNITIFFHYRAQETYQNLNKSEHAVHCPLQLPDQAESCGDSGIILLPIFPHRALLTQHCHFSIPTFPSASTQQIVGPVYSLWSHKPLITLVCCSKSSPS